MLFTTPVVNREQQAVNRKVNKVVSIQVVARQKFTKSINRFSALYHYHI